MATGPVLVFIGFLMVRLIKDIDFTDIEEGFPALLGLILMPLTFSITVGIGAAFVSYVFIKVVMGKIREVHLAALGGRHRLPHLLRAGLDQLDPAEVGDVATQPIHIGARTRRAGRRARFRLPSVGCSNGPRCLPDPA